MDKEEWSKVIDLNLTSTFSKYTIKKMLKKIWKNYKYNICSWDTGNLGKQIIQLQKVAYLQCQKAYHRICKKYNYKLYCTRFKTAMTEKINEDYKNQLKLKFR